MKGSWPVFSGALAWCAGLVFLVSEADGAAAARDPDAGPPVVPAQPFQQGDRWAAIGDSITHGRRYHSFVYLFHATRFPERPFEIFNCGISGDSAAGAVQRFDWDIGTHRPTVATIMLGMNDVNRGLYAPGKSGEAVEKQRREALQGHAKAMAQLAERLTASGCRLVLITPSIYDQTGTQTTENMVGVNDALGQCGENARELAARIGGSVIDLHTPMTRLNARLQAANPAATLVGPDRVHPGDPGQFVMAYYLLKGLGVPGAVAEIGIDAASGTVTNQENCTVSEVSDGGRSFTCLERSLPFPVLPSVAEALTWVPFTEELNREMLRVAGLPQGTYAVTIDGEQVTLATSQELAQGINLAGLPESPMLRQALRVMEIEEKRHAIAARMRTFAAQRHFLVRSNPDLDPENFEAVKAALLQNLEERKNDPRFAYFKGQVETYIAWKPREAELRKELADLTQALWKGNRPVPHRFGLAPASPAVPGTLDDFNGRASWTMTPWTDVEPALSVSSSVLTVAAPRQPGRRDMLGISRAVDGDLTGGKVLRLRYKAGKGAPFGVEVVLDGKGSRLLSYASATGDWEELSFPVTGTHLSSVTLILAEAGADAVWPTEAATYCFDWLRLE